VTIRNPDALGGHECIELTEIQSSHDCPVNFGFPRSVSFEVTAITKKSLRWRQRPGGTDVLTPPGGSIASDGSTTVTLSDLVLSDSLTIDVYQGDQIYLRFELSHK
jgi:hypothetical protein